MNKNIKSANRQIGKSNKLITWFYTACFWCVISVLYVIPAIIRAMEFVGRAIAKAWFNTMPRNMTPQEKFEFLSEIIELNIKERNELAVQLSDTDNANMQFVLFRTPTRIWDNSKG